MHGNRTHRAHLPVNTTGFEVQASHRARFTSARDSIRNRSARRVFLLLGTVLRRCNPSARWMNPSHSARERVANRLPTQVTNAGLPVPGTQKGFCFRPLWRAARNGPAADGCATFVLANAGAITYLFDPWIAIISGLACSIWTSAGGGRLAAIQAWRKAVKYNCPRIN